MKKILLSSLMILAVYAAHAGVVLSDTFTYPDGGLVGAPSSPWSAHSTGTLMLVTNNTLIVSRARAEDVNAPLAGAPYLVADPAAKLYSSFTLVISNDLPTLSGTYFAHFRGTNSGALTDFGARVFLLTTNYVNPSTGVAAGKYRVHVANGTSGLADNAAGQFDQDLSTGVVYTVVTRFIPSTGVATIWVDPVSETDPSATATDPGTAARTNQFDVFSYAFRQASGEGTIYVDNLKIGTSFGDVAGVNTSPTISSIPALRLPANGASDPIDFAVSDGESPATTLTITTSSTNTTLVPNISPNIVLDGTSTNRTITITPVTGQQGSSLITVTVSDGVNSSFTTFLVTVGAPSISPIADQATGTSTPTTAIAFTVSDAETPDTLTVTGASSNPTLVQDSKIVTSGTGTSRTVVITPEANQSGIVVITLRVSDGVQSTTTTFTLAIHPALGVQFADNFSYPDGLVTTGSGNTWLPHSSQDSNDTFVADSKLLLVSTNAMDVSAYFSNFSAVTPTSGVVLYSKFDVSFLALPRFSGGGYFAHFRDTGTSNFRARVYALTNGAAPGKFRIGVANQAASVSQVYPQDLDLNTTYTVVTRLVVANGQSTLWINPRAETSTSVSAVDLASGTDIYTYSFRQDSAIGMLTVDDLVIGTTFTEVVPFVAPPSPIPLTIEWVDGKAVLSWTDASFALQSASTIDGTFGNVSGATSPYTNTLSGPLFFRLKY
jgi:hypothetical protein